MPSEPTDGAWLDRLLDGMSDDRAANLRGALEYTLEHHAMSSKERNGARLMLESLDRRSTRPERAVGQPWVRDFPYR